MTPDRNPQSTVLSPESSVLSPFVSVVTGEGRGAIAVVRVWGSGALEVVDRAFRPRVGKGLRESPVGRLRVGRIGSGLGDEVVSVVVRGAGGTPEVEVQCHGGPAAIGLVVDALIEAGARLRSPRSWARQSAGSAIKGEAEVALGLASTARVAEVLLDQASGALDDELRQILQASPEAALARLESLLDRARQGIKMVEGWRVVLAGRPNVGKSRLLNALAGYDRAIVAPEPGTTRDVVTVLAAFGGWPIELADTAGLRIASDPIEAQGVALARTHQGQADLVVVVLDRSEPLTELDRSILLEHPGAVVVANKSDLPTSWDDATCSIITISAEHGQGIQELIEAIATRLVPVPPSPGQAIPFRSTHLRRLQAIHACYFEGRTERARRSINKWIDVQY
jgi:tRNA modification GTPase